MIRLIVFLPLLILCCGDKAQYEIKEVAIDNCIVQCTRSAWTGSILIEKMEQCKKFYAGKRCCAFVSMNSGHNIDTSWIAGEIGRITGCSK